jgi:hypothetical protein
MKRARLAARWLVLLGLAACDPSHPCDDGYYADHGMCLRIVAPAVDAGADQDGGPARTNPNANFGDPCSSAAECGGKAPVCGAPMLPVCTLVNCLQDDIPCPPDWNCLDVTAFTTDPKVKSVCVSEK